MAIMILLKRLLGMKKFILKCAIDCFMLASSLITVCFSFLPEKVFSIYPQPIFEFANDESGIIIQNRLILLLVFLVASGISKVLYTHYRKEYTIKGKNFVIKVEYGDLLEKNDGKKVITFDECYTTTVGNALGDIKSGSINGKYLRQHNAIGECIGQLIQEAGLKKLPSKSKFNKKDRYESGRVVQYENDLLMAFVKLDEKGAGKMSHNDYLNSLSVLWEEISNYCDHNDVYIPIIGSGQTTRFDGERYERQELLDMIIASYKLSPHKLKLPLKLHIVCRKEDGVSLNNIE